MKYRILIAEDEKIEREFLENLVRKEFSSDLEVISVDNGEEAVEIFKSFCPDIVMADINMPKKNGLDALKEMKEYSSKEFISIILTSYADFSYAQKGIELQIENYILKPTESSKICEVIEKALEKIKQNQNFHNSVKNLLNQVHQTKTILDSNCIYAIINRDDEKIILNYLQARGIYVKSAMCLLLSEKIEDTDVIKRIIEDYGYIYMELNLVNYYVIYIFSPLMIQKNDKDKIMEMITPYLGQVKYGWGGIQEVIGRFYLSFDEAKKAIKEINQEMDSKELLVKQKVEQLLSYIEDEKIAIIIHDLIVSLMRCDINERNDLMNSIMQELCGYAKESGVQVSFQSNLFQAEDSMKQMEYKATQSLLEILQPIKVNKYRNHSALYKKTIDYIKQNYKKSICLTDIGEALDVTPQYISQIISKEGEKGKNSFTSLVMSYRIEEAKRLIQQSYQLKNVALEVGFHSVHYFSNSFKKHTGMSPKEYQKLFKIL